jgi:copper(I)-binding protein
MRWLILALLGVVSAGASAADASSSAIGIVAPWARATPPGVCAAAVYLELTATHNDTLVHLQTPIAAAAAVHEVSHQNGVMSMRPIERLKLPAGTPLRFSPQQMHIMLTGLHRRLQAGEHFPLTLEFAAAAPVTIDVMVRAADYQP